MPPPAGSSSPRRHPVSTSYLLNRPRSQPLRSPPSLSLPPPPSDLFHISIDLASTDLDLDYPPLRAPLTPSSPPPGTARPFGASPSASPQPGSGSEIRQRASASRYRRCNGGRTPCRCPGRRRHGRLAVWAPSWALVSPHPSRLRRRRPGRFRRPRRCEAYAQDGAWRRAWRRVRRARPPPLLLP